MNKAEITITFDEDKLDALVFFLKKRDTTPLRELAKLMEDLYAQNVPAEMREYIESRSNPPRPKPKRPAPKTEEVSQ